MPLSFFELHRQTRIGIACTIKHRLWTAALGSDTLACCPKRMWRSRGGAAWRARCAAHGRSLQPAALLQPSHCPAALFCALRLSQGLRDRFQPPCANGFERRRGGAGRPGPAKAGRGAHQLKHTERPAAACSRAPAAQAAPPALLGRRETPRARRSCSERRWRRASSRTSSRPRAAAERRRPRQTAGKVRAADRLRSRLPLNSACAQAPTSNLRLRCSLGRGRGAAPAGGGAGPSTQRRRQLGSGGPAQALLPQPSGSSRTRWAG